MRYAEGSVAIDDEEVSRATAAMPALVRAIDEQKPAEALDLLRDYAARNRLPEGFAGAALLALVRREDGWEPYRDDRSALRRTAETGRLSDWLRGQELSASELDVLRGAAAGETLVEAADRRRTGVHTVTKQRRMLLGKLGARNIAHAVAIAYQRGLLT